MTLCFCCVIFSEVKIQAGKLSTMHLSRKCCPSNLAALPSSLVGRKVREEAGFTRYRAARSGSDGGGERERSEREREKSNCSISCLPLFSPRLKRGATIMGRKVLDSRGITVDKYVCAWSVLELGRSSVLNRENERSSASFG